MEHSIALCRQLSRLYVVHPEGPVAITRTNADGQVTDEIQTERSGSGRLSSSDIFPQSSWLSWVSQRYDAHKLLEWQPRAERRRDGHPDDLRRPGTGDLDVDGTDDAGATDSDPKGGGAAGNNMVEVVSNTYDYEGTPDYQPHGNGLLTETVEHVSDTESQITTYAYDWCNRRVSTSGEENFFQIQTYDNYGTNSGTVMTERPAPIPPASGSAVLVDRTVYNATGLVADSILQMEIHRPSGRTQRTTGRIPSEVWEEQLLKRTARLSPAPAPILLDLHFSLRATRKVDTGSYIEFDGQDYEIAPTARKSVTVLFHPFRKLWVLDYTPKFIWPPILGHFTLKSV